jgi:hypothetical protein
VEHINVDILMRHSVGLSDSYYSPSENELSQDYLKTLAAFTISEEKQLRHEVQKLKADTLRLTYWSVIRCEVENKDKVNTQHNK